MSMPRPDPEQNFQLYGSSECRFCRQAEALLQQHDLSYQKITVEDYFAERIDFFRFMADYKGSYPNTIPLIFHRGEFIGGATALALWVEQNVEQEVGLTEVEDF